MNWLAFWATLIGLPLAAYAAGWTLLGIVRVLFWWQQTDERVRDRYRAVGGVALVVGFAAFVGWALA